MVLGNITIYIDTPLGKGDVEREIYIERESKKSESNVQTTTIQHGIRSGSSTCKIIDHKPIVYSHTQWETCRNNNNMSLNTTKTKELILDYRRQSAVPAPLYINGDCVEKVHTFKFLGDNLSDDLSWSVNTSEKVKKAQQRLHFLRVLRKNNL